MAESVVKPRVDDFGITEEDLNRAPCLFLTGHRPAVITAAYLAASVTLFVLILKAGGSPSAAAFFSVISVAAGSILLLPVLMLVVCASERAEERWLCGRFPKLSACLAYRAAVAEHERGGRAAVPADRSSGRWWSSVSPDAFVEAVRTELERAPAGEVIAVDREATGLDFALTTADGQVLVRCEPGVQPITAAVGREMVAAMADRGAARALIVTTAEATPALADYIAGRPISVTAPTQLHAIIKK